jgi:hypothetical protein
MIIDKLKYVSKESNSKQFLQKKNVVSEKKKKKNTEGKIMGCEQITVELFLSCRPSRAQEKLCP